MQCKTCKLLISAIFHLIFSDPSWPQVSEIAENEIADKRNYFLILSQSESILPLHNLHAIKYNT
jgi:hypothetical protein